MRSMRRGIREPRKGRTALGKDRSRRGGSDPQNRRRPAAAIYNRRPAIIRRRLAELFDAMSTNNWRKEMSDRHRAAGLCLDCKEPAKSGRVRCEKHLRLHAESNRRRIPIFRKNGICPYCRKGIAERFWKCKKCRERQAELHAERNKNRTAAIGA